MTRRSTPRPAALTAAYVGAGLIALGVVLYVVAGVASAIDYNLQEDPEGSLVGPTPVWIVALGVVAIVVAASGFVALLAAPVIALVSSRRKSSV